MAQTLRDLYNMYGGNWYDAGALAGYPGWFRTSGIDPIGQPVWNQQYGWQDMATLKKLGGDWSSLTPQWGRWEQYWQPKPQGTSDPELRRTYGKDWMSHYAGDPYFNQYAASNPWLNEWGGQSLWAGGGSGYNPNQPAPPEEPIDRTAIPPTDYTPYTPPEYGAPTEKDYRRRRQNPWLNL